MILPESTRPPHLSHKPSKRCWGQKKLMMRVRVIALFYFTWFYYYTSNSHTSSCISSLIFGDGYRLARLYVLYPLYDLIYDSSNIFNTCLNKRTVYNEHFAECLLWNAKITLANQNVKLWLYFYEIQTVQYSSTCKF